MRLPLFRCLAAICCCLLPLHAQTQALAPKPMPDFVRAWGAVSVALPLLDASKVLRKEHNIELVLRAVGGTEMGLDNLADRTVVMALCSRNLTPMDRASYPAIPFYEVPIGTQFITMAVSRDVWEGGVHSITADQVREIYEGKLKNWKELGGPDTPIKVFMSEPGSGQWELFVNWLYGKIRKAPVWHGLSVKTADEARNMLEFTQGSFSLIPASYIEHRNLFALAVKEDSGELVQPTLANVINKTYPLSRPLVIVTREQPTGLVKVVTDFITSPRGQEFVKKNGYVTLEELSSVK